MYPAASRSAPRAGRRVPSKTPKIVPKMLLLRTFDDPSRGSRTMEKRPRPTSFTSPISSEATWETSLVSRIASTKRSFIQMSSSSCRSPYTFRVAAGSRRTGSSRRIRVARAAKVESSRDRSTSTFAAWSASRTSVRCPPSVLRVPSLEVVPELLPPAIEFPPGPRVCVGDVGEDLEVLHALGPDVRHLPLERLLLEGVLPDRTAGEEAGGPAPARHVDEPPEDVEVGARAQHDPRHLRRRAQPVAVPP